MRSSPLLFAALAFGCGEEKTSDPCAGVDCSPGICVSDSSSARCSCPADYEPQGLTCVPEGGSDADADADTDTDPGCQDRDGDGFPDLSCGGTDCNDSIDTIHPFAVEAGDWTAETVDATSLVELGSVSIAAWEDSLHVCYVDSDTAELRYAARIGGVWNIDESLGGGDAGGACSIAADGNRVHIVFERTGGTGTQTVYLVSDLAGGGWNEVVLDESGAPPMPAIDLDLDGQAHVVYRNECEARYRRERDGWASSPNYTNADGCGPFQPSIDVEDWGNTRLSWVGAGGHAKFAENQGGWAVRDFGATGGAETAVVNLDDAHLAWIAEGGTVTYDYQVGGVWQGGAAIENGWQVSMTKDAEHRIHMIFRGDRSVPLYVSPPSGHFYRMEVVDAGCQSPDIAAGSDGLHAAWRDRTQGIRHAFRAFPDGVDQNCDGVDGVDFDQDGHASFESWGDDCNDREASIVDCP